MRSGSASHSALFSGDKAVIYFRRLCKNVIGAAGFELFPASVPEQYTHTLKSHGFRTDDIVFTVADHNTLVQIGYSGLRDRIAQYIDLL